MKFGRIFTRGLIFGCAAMLGGIAASTLRAQEPAGPKRPIPAAPMPLPERNPARNAAPLHPGQIATPQWSAQEIQQATDRCAMLLAGTGIKYRFLDPIREGRCGTPAPIELSAIGKTSSVAIEPAARVTCGLAATLSAWADSILQPSARKHLDRQITGIRNIASYVCRNRYNAPGKPISEHARANALDMAAFRTPSGDWIQVLDNWAIPPDESAGAEETPQSEPDTPQPQSGTPAPAAEPPGQQSDLAPPAFSPQSAFLYEIHEGACTLFGTALGPETNEAHKDHFHYDLAERKYGAYCR